MTSQQRAVETVWYTLVKQLTTGTHSAIEAQVDKDAIAALGDAGAMTLAHRCRYESSNITVIPIVTESSAFRNAKVEMRRSTNPCTLTYHVFSSGSLKHNEAPVVILGANAPISITEKKATKTPRPANSFILYRQFHHSAVVSNHPNTHNNQICKYTDGFVAVSISDSQIAQIIGKMWKNEPQAVKDDWKRKSEVIKHQHAIDNPDYQYQPRRPSEKKRRRTRRTPQSVSSPASALDSSPSTPQEGLADGSPIDTSLELPNFDIGDNGKALAFTFDPSHTEQTALFEEMVANQDTIMNEPFATDFSVTPAAFATLPACFTTTSQQAQIDMPLLDNAHAQIKEFDRELASALSQEFETVHNDVNAIVPVKYSYNDFELQRFLNVVENAPEDMWGMDFINMPKK